MTYSVKIRCDTGKPGHRSVTYSTFVVEAKDEADAKRIGTFKSKQRYFGGQPNVTVISVTPLDEPMKAPTVGTLKLEVSDGKLRRVARNPA